jgi:hypothetical protein
MKIANFEITIKKVETKKVENFTLEPVNPVDEKKAAQDAAYIVLNNLYLSVARGEQKLTVRIANELRVLLDSAYDRTDEVMRDWWMYEFYKLPGWLNV